MAPTSSTRYEFVEQIPTVMAPSTIYVSIAYRTTAHLCMCGCGEKVVNPLRTNRWSLTYDGSSISLDPSIGNAGLACKSHYCIRRNNVDWCDPLSSDQIDRALAKDGWQIGRKAQAPPAGDAESEKRGWWRVARTLRRFFVRQPKRQG